MQWDKAGRKNTTGTQKMKELWDDDAMVLASNIAPHALLALAVVKQWVIDGKPQSEWQSIKQWLAVLNECITGGTHSQVYSIVQEVCNE